MTKEKQLMGKRSRAAGGRFELKVRKDLEKNWIVGKWPNNVEFSFTLDPHVQVGKCIPAKRRYNPFSKALSIGTGFPDFFAYTTFGGVNILHTELGEINGYHCVIFVESKMNGTLSKTEKEKARWYLENNYCSKFLIASKGDKRGEIVYTEFK